MENVKLLVSRIARRLACSPLTVSLLDASRAEQVTALLASVELQPGEAGDPPEWVRLLAPGVNKARDGRSYTVADPAKVVQLSHEWKGAIDLVVCFEHQTDRAATNGHRADACAWIKELAAKGPDGTPGVWARFDWLDETRALIKARKYRYLSAVVAHDAAGNVLFVPRATLTNTPALNTTTALFSADQPKDNIMLQKLLAMLGLAATTPEDKALEHVGALATLAAALAKQMGVELSVLSAMTAEALTAALTKPLADKIATLSVTAKVAADATPEAIVAGIRALGVDPKDHISRGVYDDVAGRLATLTAELSSGKIEEAKKAGKITPAMEAWAKTLSPEQLTAFLSTAPVIVAPGSGAQPGPGEQIATLSAEEKAEAVRSGVSEEAFLKAKQADAAAASRAATLAAG
ncbi:MAG: phage protease [Reyranella sp.]|nr:phage protease [Reyranella sp.]